MSTGIPMWSGEFQALMAVNPTAALHAAEFESYVMHNCAWIGDEVPMSIINAGGIYVLHNINPDDARQPEVARVVDELLAPYRLEARGSVQ